MDEEEHPRADGAHGGEGEGEQESPEVAEEGQEDIHFFKTRKNNGRETHHLQINVYRFDRRRLKTSGAGYF